LKGTIYVIKNLINGKEYVGKTFSTVEKRFKQHLIDSRKKRCENRPLYSAIRKYGEDNFEYESLGEYEESI
jgi:group I intron endonuclease